MRECKPGDLVVVPVGAYMRSALDGMQLWNDKVQLAIVISKSSYLYIDNDDSDELSGSVSVFLADAGFFFVEELVLMTLDDLDNAKHQMRKAFFEAGGAAHRPPTENSDPAR